MLLDLRTNGKVALPGTAYLMLDRYISWPWFFSSFFMVVTPVKEELVGRPGLRESSIRLDKIRRNRGGEWVCPQN